MSAPAYPIINNKKICTKCKEEKNISEFGKSKKTKSGLCSECKKCHNTCERHIHIVDLEKNKQKRKQDTKLYYIKNKEKICKRTTEWAKKNKEKTKKYGEKYYTNTLNLEKRYIRSSEWEKRNVEKRKVQKKQWFNSNPEKIKKYRTKFSNDIPNAYVAIFLQRPASDAKQYPLLFEMKRLQIQISREIKQKQLN
jgi:hypothetical protein